MNNILDLFMGDPIYDERKRVVGRDFGVKNIIAIAIVLYIGNLLMCKMKPKSEKKQMKGGGVRARHVGVVVGVLACMGVIVSLGVMYKKGWEHP